MATTRRKKSGRKSPKRVAAGRKAARTRARRKSLRSAAARKSRRRAPSRARKRAVSRWRSMTGRKRRLTVRKTRRGLRRSPYSRLGYRRGRKVRVNPRFSVRGILGRWRLQRAIPLLGGFAGAITLKPVAKQYLMNLMPVTLQMPLEKWFGVLTIIAGGWISSRSRRRLMKDVGLGMIMGGVYDVIATNFANLPFVPKVIPGTIPGGVATDTTSASIGQGDFNVVGATNISQDMSPEVVGCEDMDDLI